MGSGQLLQGKRAIVTGASRGIGLAIARAFVAEGASVVITARGADALHDAAKSLGAAEPVVCDNGDPTGIDRALDAAFAGGPVDILVNNAAISPYYKRAETVTLDEWDTVVDVNLRGTYFFSCGFANRLFEAGRPGTIINITSVLGIMPGDRLGVYSTTKAGIHQLTRGLALEWADRGIRVNAIAPGWTETDFSSDLLASRHGQGIKSAIPLGRVARPEDITGAAVYLACEASAYVTGVVLPVDGGRSAV